MTEENLGQLGDHDLLITAVAEIRQVRLDVIEIKVHQLRQNGQLAAVMGEQSQMQGALMAFRWMMATLIAVMGVGVGVAGVVLTILARGH